MVLAVVSFVTVLWTEMTLHRWAVAATMPAIALALALMYRYRARLPKPSQCADRAADRAPEVEDSHVCDSALEPDGGAAVTIHHHPLTRAPNPACDCSSSSSNPLSGDGGIADDLAELVLQLCGLPELLTLSCCSRRLRMLVEHDARAARFLREFGVVWISLEPSCGHSCFVLPAVHALSVERARDAFLRDVCSRHLQVALRGDGARETAAPAAKHVQKVQFIRPSRRAQQPLVNQVVGLDSVRSMLRVLVPLGLLPTDAHGAPAAAGSSRLRPRGGGASLEVIVAASQMVNGEWRLLSHGGWALRGARRVEEKAAMERDGCRVVHARAPAPAPAPAPTPTLTHAPAPAPTSAQTEAGPLEAGVSEAAGGPDGPDSLWVERMDPFGAIYWEHSVTGETARLPASAVEPIEGASSAPASNGAARSVEAGGAADDSAREWECTPPHEGPVRMLVRVHSGVVRVALKRVRMLPIEIRREHLAPLDGGSVRTPTILAATPAECHGCCACLGLFPTESWRQRRLALDHE